MLIDDIYLEGDKYTLLIDEQKNKGKGIEIGFFIAKIEEDMVMRYTASSSDLLSPEEVKALITRNNYVFKTVTVLAEINESNLLTATKQALAAFRDWHNARMQNEVYKYIQSKLKMVENDVEKFLEEPDKIGCFEKGSVS